MSSTISSTGEPAAWDRRPWCERAGIGYSTYPLLDPACKPHTVQIGRREKITEPPAQWVERMASIGGARLSRER